MKILQMNKDMILITLKWRERWGCYSGYKLSIQAMDMLIWYDHKIFMLVIRIVTESREW